MALLREWIEISLEDQYLLITLAHIVHFVLFAVDTQLSLEGQFLFPFVPSQLPSPTCWSIMIGTIKPKLWQSFLQSIEEMPGLDKKNFSFFSLLPECESLISINLPQTDLPWTHCIYKPIYEQPTQYKYLEKEQVSESLSGFNSATVFKKLCCFWKEGKTMLSPIS